MKKGTLFTLLILPSVVAAITLLATAAVLFSSINDAFIITLREWPEQQLSSESTTTVAATLDHVPSESRHRHSSHYNSAENNWRFDPRTPYRKPWNASQRRRRPSYADPGFNQPPWNLPDDEGAPSIDELAFRTSLPTDKTNRTDRQIIFPTHAEEYEVDQPSNDEDREGRRGGESAEIVIPVIEAAKVERQIQDDENGVKHMVGAKCKNISVVIMFWGLSVATIVIAVVQLVLTTVTFTISTKHTKAVTAVWMIGNMTLIVGLTILTYLSVYYYERDSCEAVAFFDGKWLMFIILLIMDTILLIVLVSYSYYVFKVKTDELLRHHETDSQREKRRSTPSTLLRSAIMKTTLYN